MKKGGGTGPVKPWQPAGSIAIGKEKVPNPIQICCGELEKISIRVVF